MLNDIRGTGRAADVSIYADRSVAVRRGRELTPLRASYTAAERMAAENHARFGKLHFMGGKPKHQFEVQADGTIQVKIRRGDSELVQIFADEDDLADRSPNLYEKFADLMDLENE